MKKNITLIVFMLIMINGCAVNQPKPMTDWQLLYHNGVDGEAIAGSKSRLIAAIENGRPIRIVWPLNDRFMHVADAGFLTVMNGEVFAQFNGIIRQIPDRETRRSIALDAKNQSQWHAIVSTTGQLRAFQSIEGDLNNHQFAYKWYGLTASK